MLSTALAAGPALADIRSGLYLGMGSGVSRLMPGIENAEVTERDKIGTVANLFLGYELTRAINVELSYTDLGSTTLKPVGSIDYQDINVSALYHFGGSAVKRSQKPFSFYARFGVGTIRNQSNIAIERSHSAHWLAGAGIQLPITDRLAFRAEGTNYDSDVSSLGVSLLYRFTRPGAQNLQLAGKTDHQTSADDLTVSELNAAVSSKNILGSQPGFPLDPMAPLNAGYYRPGPASSGNQVADSTKMAQSHWLIDATTPLAKPAQNLVNSVDPAGNNAGSNATTTSLQLGQAQPELPSLAAALPLEVTQKAGLPAFAPVQFNFDSNSIDDYDKEQLIPLAEHLRINPDVHVVLTGHTDSVGNEKYNQLLSVRRAEAIREFLLQQGIDRKMIRIIGAGEKRPAKSNRTLSGRKANRRVEIAIT